MSSLKPPLRCRILPHSPWRPGKARNGKIARLPEKLRESINLMLLDGFTYEAVIASLGPDGRHLNYHNLKRWRQGGYQDWLLARQRGDRAQLRQQFVQKIISQSDPKDLPSKMKAALATQHLESVLDYDPLDLKENLEADPVTYISLLNIIAAKG
jgi:hypothetical protein